MAKKYEIKKLGRRSLALFLSLILLISGANITAFGAGYPDQTMEGYYEVDSNGEAVLSELTSVEEDGFTLSKTIEQTGLNEFEITLKVVTSQTVTTNDAALAIVIDNSSSMEECAEGCNGECSKPGHKNRLEAIQEVLTKNDGFLDNLAEANTGSVYVSVVKFDANAHKVTEWLDIKEAANLASVKRSINGIDPGKGTNIHGGLMLGRNRLAMDSLDAVGSKYLVLLSDGEPYHNSSESRSIESINGSQGWGNNPKNLAISVAEGIRNSGTTIYSVGYGYSDDVLEDISGSEERTFSGNDSAAINAAFADIAESAAEGMSGAGTKVVDPMGQFVVMGSLEGLDGVAANGNGLEWNLSTENAVVEESEDGTLVTYTYEVTYPITLNTAAVGFEETNEDGSVKYYPTNGYTYLNVPQEDGSVKKIAFLVPGVCGEIPEVEWTLEYYLQDESSLGGEPTYTLDKDLEMGEAKLYSTVNAPEGYEDEYADDDYYYAGGNPSMIIRTEDNVMKLYYNIIAEKVTENHFYKTDKILADGTEVTAEYPAEPQKTYPDIEVKINTEYEAEPEPEFDNAMYELDFTDPESGKITVYKDAENVINLYYTRLIDERATTSAIVNHVYTTYGYELNEDGQYELVELGSQEEVATAASDLRATTVFNVSDQPLEGFEEFELNVELGDYEELLQEDGSLSFIVKEDPQDNIRTLYFDKVVDNRELVEVTVNHYYTKTIISYENGEEVVDYDPNGIKGHSESEEVYKGETYEAFEIYSYDGDIYEADAGNEGKLVIEKVEGGEVIDLYYNLVVRPEKTELVVNHTWRTFTEVTTELTEEVWDEATSSTAIVVVGTKTETVVTEDHYIDGSDDPIELFEGEAYTAELKAWGEGYDYNDEESNRYGIGGVDSVLDLYYDKYDAVDEREDASIDVLHKYYTYVTSIVDGEIETVRVADGTVEEEYPEMKAGDEFTASAELIYNENEYVQITDESELGPVVLQPGTNATIVIEYEREVNELVETEYVVNYEYRTYEMIIEDGKAVYGEPTVESITGEAISGYVGEKVVLEDGSRAGFTPLSSNPATEHFLAADGNEWTFVHEKYNDLSKVNVEVNHHYTIVTIAENGESSSSTFSVDGASAELFAGESYTAEAVPNGFTQNGLKVNGADEALASEITVTVEGNTVIDFYYTKTVDNSVSVPYTIKHVYNYYDWDGQLINSSTGDPITSGTGYVTSLITASPEPNGYELVEATYNGEDLALGETSYTITLQNGNNDVVFTYELHKERDKIDVKVVHNYYKDEAAITEGADPLEKVEMTETEIFEGEEYSADKIEKDGFVFHSADPEELKITVTEGEDNIIILNYVRAEASYKVVHIYNKNGVEENRTSETFGGYDGDEIKADSIARVPSNNGKNYSFVSITGDIVLDDDEVKTITLVYNRTVSGPKPPKDPDPTPTPTPDPDPIPEPEPDPIDIPDPEVPLAPEPDFPEEPIEIFDEDVPLADVPKTGDQMALYYASAALSALGLVILALTGKKREEEA